MAEKDHNGHTHGDHHHGHITDLPDVSYIKNVDVTHEASDVSVEGLAWFVIGLTLMTIATFGLMFALFKLLDRQFESRSYESRPGPMAMTQQERIPPEPRLQEAPGFGVKLENGSVVNLDSVHAPGKPQEEYRVLLAQWERVLTTGKTDETSPSVGLPIDQAMKKLLESNVIKTKPGAGNWDEYSGNLPTTASSGRMSQKAK